MFTATKAAEYYAGLNEPLLRAVPPSARSILEVGCAEGRLGAALKALDPARRVVGVEREPAIAARAATRLDEVFTLDLEKDDPPLAPGSVDCIVYGDILEHLVDPGALLARQRRLLAPGGTIVCSVPNAQHHSVVSALLRSDLQYEPAGLLDATHLRFFTYSTFIKLLLDAGYAPSIADTIAVPCPKETLAVAGPLLRALGLHPGRTRHYLDTYQYIFRGRPLGTDKPSLAPAGTSRRQGEPPLTFVACVSDEATLRANLFSSPCLAAGTPHEVLLMRGCRSAAEGLNRGLAQARNPVVVCVHQDVYLPRGWPARFWDQYRQVETTLGPVGVVGVYGVSSRSGLMGRAGHVVDRHLLLREGPRLPASVDTLDELLLAVRKDAGLAFEPRVGFHFYGADVCLAARQRQFAVAAIDALCFHNSRTLGLPPEFFRSGRAFAAKWRRALPVVTSCAVVDPNGTVKPLH